MTTITYKKVLCVILFLFFFITGCDKDIALVADDALAQNETPRVESILTYGTPEGIVEDDLSMEERQQRLKKTNEVVLDFMTVAKDAETWEEADFEVRNLLSAQAYDTQPYYLEQSAAGVMLNVWLLDEEDARMDQEATAYYTQLLLKNRNPNAALILAGLKSLDGYWSAEQVTQSAANAVRFTKARFAGKKYCADCDLEKLKDVLPVDMSEAQRQFFYQMQGAIDELKAMSKPSP